MTRVPIEVTRQDRIYCLKASSDYHSEVCEECKFYPNCDHMTQDDLTESTIKDLEVLEQEPCEDAISRQAVLAIAGDSCLDLDSYEDTKEFCDEIKELPSVNPKTDKFDRIRAEIEQNAYPIVHGVNNHEKGMTLYGILQIIDKYKTESEEK